MVKIRVIKGEIEDIKDEIILVGVFEETKKFSGAASKVDKLTSGMVKKVTGCGDFSGKLSHTLMIYSNNCLRLQRILLVGLGKEKEFDLDTLRGAVSSAACYCRDIGIKSIVVPFSFVQSKKFLRRGKVTAFVEGILLGLYRFDEFKSKKNREKMAESILLQYLLTAKTT